MHLLERNKRWEPGKPNFFGVKQHLLCNYNMKKRVVITMLCGGLLANSRKLLAHNYHFRLFCFLSAFFVGHVATFASDNDVKILFLGDQKGHKPSLRFRIIEPVMAERGIKLTYTEDADELNVKSLSNYDGLVLYANIDTIKPSQAKALLDYVASGKGFVPIHCATFCFRNSPEVVALMGGQFKSHGQGEMTTQSAGVEHPILEGYQTFTSFDETYVHHKHNEQNRMVLEYRAGGAQSNGNTREPWTWIRTHGTGRVFYTAWGHDSHTWNQPHFHNLLERGIRWACGAGETGITAAPAVATTLPPMRKLPGDLLPFEYMDVGPEIPNYNADRSKGRLGKPIKLMQRPSPAEESIKHIVTPEGFHVELFADENEIHGIEEQDRPDAYPAGKPIAMNWDEKGRLWVCETVDYPNELSESGSGRDRIRVLEDTDGDNRADKSSVFAEGLSIPTAIAFHRGGLVVQNGTETLYLKDTTGDGTADIRKVLMSNWTLGDTHGGVGNFRNGLDNWIWAMQGYNTSSPVINGVEQPAFRMGFFRFRLSQDDDPVVEKLEFIRSTNNNTWGLGISEEGLIFGSTANRNPSVFMPIANRYYERVRGWTASLRLGTIADTHLFKPITKKVRQVDHHGGYTAAAGHALYTARNYPQPWWNRTAFVCGPTGKLVGTFVIERDGAGMKSSSPVNLFASNDEWTAPIMAEVGPDGNVWVLDWYNFIVQHNPTPQGFETGKGAAYETKLRDKKYGRIYRVVPDKPRGASFRPVIKNPDKLESCRTDQLTHPTMLVRLHAQRLLVEHGDAEIVPELISLIEDQAVDGIGLNVGAIHALNTLHGLGVLQDDSSPAFDAVTKALTHPSAGVRLNAVRVLPEIPATLAALQEANVIADTDNQVVLAALLKMSDLPVGDAGRNLRGLVNDTKILSDRWLKDALTSAAAMHAESFLTAVLEHQQPIDPRSNDLIVRVAEHFARTRPTKEPVSEILTAMAKSSNKARDAIIRGLAAGWPKDHIIKLDASVDADLQSVFVSASVSVKASLARLAGSWSNQSLQKEIAPIVTGFIRWIEDDSLAIKDRINAANELMQLDSGRVDSAEAIEGLIGPHSPISLSVGLIQTISRSKAPGLAGRFARINKTATPALRAEVLRVMLSRPELTTQLLSLIKAGELHISDLSTQQVGILSRYPSAEVRQGMRDVMRSSGVTISNDRNKLVAAKMPLTERTGDSEIGKAVFTKNCAACHIFKGEGKTVGPNLNGMSVHPKAELLTHILDPNRSVEANYRQYTVLTVDGVVISGLLAAESLTTIEVIDAQGKRHTILREDIEELMASRKSAMPEGFEQSINDEGFVNLLEYLTEHEQFIPLGLEKVANTVSTHGMFSRRDNKHERLILPKWGTISFNGIPFSLIDPQGTTVNNVVMLNGPHGPFAPQMPKSISIRSRTSVKGIHMLSGVAGWASQKPSQGKACLIVRLKYADGKTEEHPLIDGQHFADYIGTFDVPKSQLAFKAADGGQLRYLSIHPKRDKVIETIELVKPDHHTAPLVAAMTLEVPRSHVDAETHEDD